jgi:hypothetical protein
VDALLAEAHQLNFTTDDVLRVVDERRQVMERKPRLRLASEEK